MKNLLILAISCLLLGCAQDHQKTDKEALYELRNQKQDMNPLWNEQYVEQKFCEDVKLPEPFSAYMRKIQAQEYALKSSTPGVREIVEIGPSNIAGRVRAFVQDSPASYTHLTLPTNRDVERSVAVGTINKKQNIQTNRS